MESCCTAMGPVGNSALTAEHPVSDCSPTPYPTSSQAPFTQNTCFYTLFCRKHYFHLHLRHEIRALFSPLHRFFCSCATYVAQPKGFLHDIYSNSKSQMQLFCQYKPNYTGWDVRIWLNHTSEFFFFNLNSIIFVDQICINVANLLFHRKSKAVFYKTINAL